MDGFVRDTRNALRSVRGNARQLLLAVGVLALGLGVNVGVFAVVSGVLLRPLTAKAPHELRYVRAIDPRAPEGRAPTLTYRDFRYIEQERELFSGVLARAVDASTARFDRAGASLTGEMVTRNYFEVLGVVPRLGHVFDLVRSPSGGSPVVVISHNLWMTRFGGRSDALGKKLALGTRRYEEVYGDFADYTIIGVMEPGFRGTLGPWRRTDYWVVWDQRALDFAEDEPDHERTIPVLVLGRVKPGISNASAEAAIHVVGRRIQTDLHPSQPTLALTLQASHSSSVPFDPKRRFTPGTYAVALLLISGAVLLIALVNLTGTLALHSINREGERAVCVALGAPPVRLWRQALIEGFAVALAAGGCALLLGRAVAWAILWAMPEVVGRYEIERLSVDAPTDWRVLLFTATLTVFSGCLVGVMAGRTVRRRSLTAVLQATCANTGRRRIGRGLRFIAVAQVSLSFALAVLSAAFTGALVERESRDRGYVTDGVVLVQFLLPPSDSSHSGRGETAHRLSVLRRMIVRFKERRPNESVALVDFPPFMSSGVSVLAASHGDDAVPRRVSTASVSEDYFRVLQIRSIRGRTFEERDGLDPNPGVVVSNSLARALWGNEDPVGQRLCFAGARNRQQRVWRRVLGVVADTVSPVSGADGTSMVYTTMGSVSYGLPSFAVARGLGGQAEVLSALLEAVESGDERIIIAAGTTLEARFAPLLYVRRFGTVLLQVCAAIAVGLAGLGLYGLTSFLAAESRDEMAVRIALGARPHDVALLVMRQGLVVALAGAAIGLPLAYGAAVFLSHLDVHVPTPGLVGSLALLLLIAVVTVACYPAARRAAGFDPMYVLRTQ